MKRLILAAVLAVSAGAVAQSVLNLGSGQANVATGGGTITYYIPGNGQAVLYIGNGQAPVWTGSIAEFRTAMRRGAGMAEAYTQ